MVKTRTKTSPVWEKFSLSSDNKRAKCNHCGETLEYNSRYGPRNLIQHLETQRCLKRKSSKGRKLRGSRKRRSRKLRSRKLRSRRSRSRRSRSRRSRSRRSRSRKSRSRRSRKTRSRRSRSRRSRSRRSRSRRSRRTRSRRKARRSYMTKSSKVWSMYTISKNNNRATCKNCGKILVYSSKSGPRNLVLHLNSKRCVDA